MHRNPSLHFLLRLIGLCGLISIPVEATPVPSKPLSLREAVLYAVENSPELNTTERRLTSARLTRRNRLAAFFPSLDFSVVHGLQSMLIPAATPWTTAAELALTETLFDNGRNFTGYQISLLNEDISELQLKDRRNELAFEISRLYYELSLAQRLLEVREEQLSLLRKQFESASAQYRQGMRAQRDFIRFKTQTQRAEIDVLNARNDLARLRSDLQRVLGVPEIEGGPVETDFAVVPIQPVPSSSVPTTRPELTEHLRFRTARLTDDVLDHQVSLVRRELWPRLTLSAGASYGYYQNQVSPVLFRDATRWNWNVLLRLDFNILDWGTRRRDTDIARQEAAVTRNTFTAGLLGLENEIERLMLDLQVLRKSYELAAELLSLERESFKLLEEEYRLGRVSFLDFIAAVENFQNAKASYYRAHYGLLRSLARYRYHQGNLYDQVISSSR